MIRNPRFHRRCDPERLMDPAKVVEGKPEGVSGLQVLPLLAEARLRPVLLVL